MGTNITGIGNANAIGFKSRVTGGMYFPPELKDALVGVWSAYGKSNNSTDRNIIKNKIKDKGGDFVISNSAYIEGSGYADKDSPYYGAFVTDGIDDLITSTKTVQEMLGGSNEITVVSMIHQYYLNSVYNKAFTNYLEVLDGTSYIRNDVDNEDKTGIYGYTSKLNTNVATVINNILGDKSDYISRSTNIYNSLSKSKFSVVGRISGFKETTSVAWYWTFIANRVLTTDEINQVIAYYNLDRTLKPDILCNTIKQGITNENHAEFGDKLIDYSGNDRDIQLNNIAWNKESGIDDNGALCLDGIDDFGKVTGMPIYKDYTVVADYERFYLEPIAGGRASILSKSSKLGDGAFVFNLENTDGKRSTYSFGEATNGILNDITRSVRYQSKYYNTKTLNIGTAEDNDFMLLGKVRVLDGRFFNGAIYSLMSFPYSMSKFLIERQLKKHKLGTLYPDMVEFRPVIKANANYNIFYTALLPLTGDIWEIINIGDYVPVGRRIAIQMSFDNEASELVSAISSQLGNISITKNSNNKGYTIFGDILKNKSPQKINITIDEYIRYEDIVQPYPVLLRFNDENGNEVSWGGKFRVGSTITRIGSIDDTENNLLNGLYSISGLSLNGKAVTSSTSIVEKQMVFKTTATYLLDNNEPKCILSPSRLRIPNSSYKLLGYIPDISGHGNHGVIYNSAYAEGSGVNEDGSYQFDGVDDFVSIPTITGGKQVLMKVNWQSYAGGVTLYDQRLNLSDYEFAIYNGDRDLDDNPIPAYQGRNNGQTYIDGILNSNIKASELRHITHNITITNELSLGTNNTYPVIGSTRWNTHFAQMSLYDFMLFDEVSTDEEIKQLNDIVGIEGDFNLDFNNDFLIGN